MREAKAKAAQDRSERNAAGLVVQAYRAAGVDLVPGKTDEQVTPGDIAEVLDSAP